MRDWLLTEFATSTFNQCPHHPMPKMKCEPITIHVDPTATPMAIHTPVLVPIHWKDQVHEQLEKAVVQGVLECVPPVTPTTWCHRMVITAKPMGQPR